MRKLNRQEKRELRNIESAVVLVDFIARNYKTDAVDRIKEAVEDVLCHIEGGDAPGFAYLRLALAGDDVLGDVPCTPGTRAWFKQLRLCKHVRGLHVYDNGGKTIDRYTVVVRRKGWTVGPGMQPMIAMSGEPTHPQGFSQYCEGHEGKHLGKRISFFQLPRNVQDHVLARLV